MIHIDKQTVERLQALISNVPGFPRDGIVFRDITPLLRDPAGLSLAMELMAQPFRGQHVDVVVGAESRGFIFGMAVAAKLSAGFVPARKPGRLPRPANAAKYSLEYGTDSLEMHKDALGPGDRVLLVDDLLATGGTMEACVKLVEQSGAEIIGMAFLIELLALNGRARLDHLPIHTIVKYE